VVAIAAAISPYKAIRDENRREIGRFVEVFCDCPLPALEARDTKGLYAKARRGEVQQFTGISDPYEPPDRAEVVLHTDRERVEQSAGTILRTLELLGYIRARDGSPTDAREDEAIRRRLKDLGY
jgi:adenylylsulfate kinase-like enzyme